MTDPQTQEGAQPIEQGVEQKTVEIPLVKKQEQIPFLVQVNDKDIPGIYSNAVSVRVQAQEIVLDFGYIVPKISKDEQDIIRLIKRVNLPLGCANELARILMSTMESVALSHLQKPVPQPVDPNPQQ